jgi:hypothetical protein
MKNTYLLWIITISLFTVSCRKDVIRGGGSISTRTLVLPAFSSVESHYDIKANISYQVSQEVTVTGYDNLLNILDVRVENGVLKLKYNQDYNTIRNGNVVTNIKVPAVSGTVIHGSNDIRVGGFLKGDSLHTKIHGSGNIHIENSQYRTALLEVFGSGKIDAQALQTKEAEANIHGSGRISISVSHRLKAGIFGSGNIYYWGNPVLETTINGSGRIIKR